MHFPILIFFCSFYFFLSHFSFSQKKTQQSKSSPRSQTAAATFAAEATRWAAALRSTAGRLGRRPAGPCRGSPAADDLGGGKVVFFFSRGRRLGLFGGFERLLMCGFVVFLRGNGSCWVCLFGEVCRVWLASVRSGPSHQRRAGALARLVPWLRACWLASILEEPSRPAMEAPSSFATAVDGTIYLRCCKCRCRSFLALR